jgi:hypothetical protein
VGQTEYGEVRTVVVADDNGDEHSVWLFTTVILNEFRKQRPKPGERIGLRYLGKHPEKHYHRYRLMVDRPEPADPFAPLGGEAQVVEDDDIPEPKGRARVS